MRQTSLLRRRCSRRSIRRRLSVNAAGVVRQRSTLPCTTDTILQLVVLQWRVHARWSAADAVTLDSVAAPVNRRKRAILDCSRPQHTHPHLMALCPGLPGWAGTRKVKPIWILLKQETVSGSGISWAICKCAPHSRQITTPAHHHSDFYRPDALRAAQPAASKHWRDILCSRPQDHRKIIATSN